MNLLIFGNELIRSQHHYYSYLIALLDFGEVAHFDLVWPLKIPPSHIAKEVMVSVDCAVSKTDLCLVKLDPNEPAVSKFTYFSYESDFSTSSVFQLASHSHRKSIGNWMQIFGIANFRLSGEGMFDLWVFQQKFMFPFSEVIGKFVVGFFTHDVFFNLVVVFYFLENGIWV